jgi:hypothetical protein
MMRLYLYLLDPYCCSSWSWHKKVLKEKKKMEFGREFV